MASRLYIPSNMEITIRKKFKKMNSTIDESLTVIDDFLLFGNRSNELKEKKQYEYQLVDSSFGNEI